MFKNKHFIVALLIAPILSIMAYFATDALVGEQPQKAEPGASYELIALPNCRYPSGHCGLKNGNFNITLTVDGKAGQELLTLTSAFKLDAVKVAMIDDPGETGVPQAMMTTDELTWTWPLPFSPTHTSRLRVVVLAQQASYFGTTGFAFAEEKQ